MRFSRSLASLAIAACLPVCAQTGNDFGQGADAIRRLGEEDVSNVRGSKGLGAVDDPNCSVDRKACFDRARPLEPNRRERAAAICDQQYSYCRPTTPQARAEENAIRSYMKPPATTLPTAPASPRAGIPGAASGASAAAPTSPSRQPGKGNEEYVERWDPACDSARSTCDRNRDRKDTGAGEGCHVTWAQCKQRTLHRVLVTSPGDGAASAPTHKPNTPAKPPATPQTSGTPASSSQAFKDPECGILKNRDSSDKLMERNMDRWVALVARCP